MIYKNVSASKLPWIFLIRFFLDNVAAVQMLLTGNRLNAKAVWNARRDFWKMRMAYKNKRRNNLRAAKVLAINTISKRSIIFDYYVRGKRK